MGRWRRSAIKMFVHREEKIFEYRPSARVITAPVIQNFTVLVIDDWSLLPLLGWVYFILNPESFETLHIQSTAQAASRCCSSVVLRQTEHPSRVERNPPAVSWDVFRLSLHSSGFFKHWRSLCVVISINYLQSLRAAAGWREAALGGSILRFCRCDFLRTPLLCSFNHCSVTAVCRARRSSRSGCVMAVFPGQMFWSGSASQHSISDQSPYSLSLSLATLDMVS